MQGNAELGGAMTKSLEKLNKLINAILCKIKYSYLLAIFMIVFAFLIIDPPKSGIMAFAASELGVSPRVYALWLVASGVWLLARPQTKAITLYCMPLAFYAVAAVLYSMSGVESARVTSLWYAMLTIVVMIIGAKNDGDHDNA